MGKNQHVTPKGDKWQVKGAGNDKATKLFDTQKEAMDYARKVAGNQEAKMIVHRADGKIRESSSPRKATTCKSKMKGFS
jgi:hypothetical protein